MLCFFAKLLEVFIKEQLQDVVTDKNMIPLSVWVPAWKDALLHKMVFWELLSWMIRINMAKRATIPGEMGPYFSTKSSPGATWKNPMDGQRISTPSYIILPCGSRTKFCEKSILVEVPMHLIGNLAMIQVVRSVILILAVLTVETFTEAFWALASRVLVLTVGVLIIGVLHVYVPPLTIWSSTSRLVAFWPPAFWRLRFVRWCLDHRCIAVSVRSVKTVVSDWLKKSINVN